VGHNVSIFDAVALGRTLDITWPWHKTVDTLRAGHILASNKPHDLTSMCVMYLGEDLTSYEKALEAATKEARAYVASSAVYGAWQVCKPGLPQAPSAKAQAWRFDTWLPRALARKLTYKQPHPWYTVLAEYANMDSAAALALWKVLEAELHRRSLWAIFTACCQLPPSVVAMSQRGVTASLARTQKLETRLRQESSAAATTLLRIARDHDYELELPKGAVNNNLRSFCFDYLKLPTFRNGKAKTENPSLDSKVVLPHYLATLPQASDQWKFVRNLADKRLRDTALGFLESYRRYWLPVGNSDTYVMHPSANPTGTDTLRFTFANPNSAQVGKKEEANLRYIFGPGPGREWWVMDAENIELRIPAYECNERAFIELFERPNDPPYYGSNHLMIAHLLHPREFEQCRGPGGELDGRIFKVRYRATLYQDTKNGDFATQYEAGDATADATFKVPGARRIIKRKFIKQEGLNQYWLKFAEKNGYVETMPDKMVDPHRGYPLLVTRSEWGRVKPTIPLCYHVQGTAMWWMMRAMIRCHTQLQEWRAKFKFDAHMVLQVHDELVFDFPYKAGQGNLARAMQLKKLMEQGGEDIGVPTPVGLEYCEETWK
jgi:DNA polymerase I-like protein with 3'-5' exonuclease and polymerase domains